MSNLYNLSYGRGRNMGELASQLALFDTSQPVDIAELSEPEDPLVEDVRIKLLLMLGSIPLDDTLDNESLACAMAPSVAYELQVAYNQGQKDGPVSLHPSSGETIG